MEFRILGKVEVWRDGEPLTIGGGRQRAVLVALLTHADEPIPRSRLIELVWGKPPDSAEPNLRTYLGRLRRVLAESLDDEPRIRVDDGLVSIRVADDELDLRTFESLIRDGDEAADPAAAVHHYGRALELWRGEPFQDAVLDAPLAAVAARLRERHAAIVHKWRAARLSTGERGAVVAELRSAVATEPLSEPTVELLMRALYFGGRTDEALALFRDTRARLIGELGVEPSKSLEELHRRMLTGEEPQAPQQERVRATVAGVAPAQLPADVLTFSGRGPELEAITAAARDSARGAPIVSSIEGMAGIGKTALAIRAATRLAPEFPDGQLFIDLHGFDPDAPPTDPAAALDRLLRGLGVDAKEIPESLDERASLYRSILHNRRLLVVLDNASSEEQVTPLLPVGEASMAIVTSRRSLASIDQARPIRLDVLSRNEAVELLASIIGRERVESEDVAVAEDVVVACGGLPLAVRIAAARLRKRPEWTLEDLRDRLDTTGLTELSTGDRSVTAAFEVSYADLSEAARVLFRRLGLHPGHDVDTYAAAALADLPPEAARDILEELVDANLLSERETGRYVLHDLVREYAHSRAELDESEANRSLAVTRLLVMYHDAARSARRTVLGQPTSTSAPNWRESVPAPGFSRRRDAFDWCARELENLVRVLGLARRLGHHEHVWRITDALWPYLIHNSRTDRMLELAHVAAESAEIHGDAEGRAAIAKEMAIALCSFGRITEGIAEFHRARETANPVQLMEILSNLAKAHNLIGQYDIALSTIDKALDLANSGTDCRHQRAFLLSRQADVYEQLGQYDAALRVYREVLELYQELGKHAKIALTQYNLGEIYVRLGEYTSAQTYHRRSLTYFQDDNDLDGVAVSLNMLGASYRGLGRYREAIEYHQRALEVSVEPNLVSSRCEIFYQLGLTYQHSGDFHQALTAYNESLQHAKAAGQPLSEAMAHQGVAECLARTHNREQARPHLHDALALYEQINHPRATEVREQLAELVPDRDHSGLPPSPISLPSGSR